MTLFSLAQLYIITSFPQVYVYVSVAFACITLFKDTRASTGRRFRYWVAMNAPNRLIKRIWKIGMDATSKSDQKPIFDFPKFVIYIYIKLNLQRWVWSLPVWYMIRSATRNLSVCYCFSTSNKLKRRKILRNSTKRETKNGHQNSKLTK